MHKLRGIGPSLIAGIALVSSLLPATAHVAGAQDIPSSITIGINLPFTGADAADATNIRDGALMAIEEIILAFIEQVRLPSDLAL